MVIETEREFGGEGSARIRVRVKRWRIEDTFDRIEEKYSRRYPFDPGPTPLPIGWPYVERNYLKRWRCPICGSHDCIAHVQCNNGKTITADYGRYPWTGGLGAGPMVAS